MLRPVGFGVLLVAFAMTSAAQPLRLGLVVDLPDGTPASVITGFQTETERLIAIPDVDVIWQQIEDSDGTQSFDRIVVLRLHGDCTMRAVAPSEADQPLGITHVSDGRVLPFADVDCDQVNAALSTSYLPNGYVLGRALAKVSAHEIYHVLTSSADHCLSGLGKPTLRASEMLSPAFGFSADAVQRMQKGLFDGRSRPISGVVSSEE